MSRTTARLALGFSLLGLVVSVMASYGHLRMLTDPTYLSFCDVNATVSCTQVYSSPYGSVFGIPVAVFGAIWFALAALLSWAGLAARPDVQENAAAYLFAGSTLALSAVLYLAYASFAVLGSVCILCVLTYVAAIGLFLVSGAASAAPLLSLPRRAAADLRVAARSPLALGLGLAFVAASAAALALFPRAHATAAATPPAPSEDAIRAQQADFEAWYTAQPRIALNVPSEGARVVIVKFNDYQCPACGQAHANYKGVLARFEAEQPGAVRLVTKDFPLEPECNPEVTTNLHPAACDAAVAVRLARERQQGAALEDWLFANQSSLTPEAVRQAARQVGQVTDMDARYAVTMEAVKADIAYGRQLGVRSTPTFYINGVLIQGGLSPALLEQAIRYELQKSGS